MSRAKTAESAKTREFIKAIAVEAAKRLTEDHVISFREAYGLSKNVIEGWGWKSVEVHTSMPSRVIKMYAELVVTDASENNPMPLRAKTEESN